MIPFFNRTPWATKGRRESDAELQSRCRLQKDSLVLWKETPTVSLVGRATEQSYPHVEFVRDAAAATGDWIGFLPPGDRLNPTAVYELLRAAEPGVDVLYAHEIRMGARPILVTKPDFSPFTLEHANYIGNFFLVRRSLYRPGDPWTLLRGLASEGRTFRLVPSYLLHTAAPYPALRQVTPPPLGERPTVSAVVCFKDRADLTIDCVSRLSGVQIILVNNRSQPAERARVAEWAARHGAVLVDKDMPFNYARLHNESIREQAHGEFLFFLNNDVLLPRAFPLDTLLAWAKRPDVGTVGFTLRYPDGRLQHGGLGASPGGIDRHVRIAPVQDENPICRATREVFANTLAACLVSRRNFEEWGGLREHDVPNGFGDVVFHFEGLKRGKRHLFLASLEAQHLESATRGRTYEYWEECFVAREYPALITSMLERDWSWRPLTPKLSETALSFLKTVVRARFPELGRWA